MSGQRARIAVAGLVLVVGSIAMSASDAAATSYVPTPGITVSTSTPAPGEDVRVVFKDGTFPGDNGGENVLVVIRGFDASSITGTVEASGRGFARDRTLPLLISASADPDRLEFTEPATNSGLIFTMKMPSDAKGDYVISGTGEVSGNTLSADVSVRPKTGSGSGTLPGTGVNAALLAVLAGCAVIAVAAGTALFASSRRRRSSRVAARR